MIIATTIDMIALRHYYHFPMNKSMKTIPMRIKDLMRMHNPLHPNTQRWRRWRFANVVCTRLGTVYMLYPWTDNSYSSGSSSSILERRWRCTGIIIILIVSIWQYIIHHTRHTILIVTGHHHHKWLLHYHPCTKSSVPTWYHHIKQSTESPN